MLALSNLTPLMASFLIAASSAFAAEEPLGSDRDRDSTHGAHEAKGEMAETGDAPRDIIPGEILVKFEEDVSQEEIDRINRRLGATVVHTMLDGRLMLITIPYENATAQLIDAYAETEGVEYAEPNREVSIIPPPKDETGSQAPSEQGVRRGGGLPPLNEDGSPPLVPLPGPD